jgi:hypothetical protein
LDRDRGVFRLPEGCEPGARYVELGEALLAALLDGREFESAPTEACQIFWVLDAVLVAGSDFSFLRALRGRQMSFEEDSELFRGALLESRTERSQRFSRLRRATYGSFVTASSLAVKRGGTAWTFLFSVSPERYGRGVATALWLGVFEEKAQAAGFYVGFGSAGAPAGLSLGARL